MAPPSVSVIPSVTVSVQSGTDVAPKQLININGISFTGTVLFYSESFPVQGGAPTAPGILIPFLTNPSATIPNNAPIVYVRNLDTTAIIAMTIWLPTAAGGSGAQPDQINIGPGGFVLIFNPQNGQSGGAIASGVNPGAVGLGASTVPGGGPAALINMATVAGNQTVVYAEVLVAG
jgi:hypothetical protein